MARPACAWSVSREVSLRRFSWISIVCVLALGGCAGANAARAPSASAGDPAATPNGDADRVSSLVRKQEEQQKRIAELETRLTLLETEGRKHRASYDGMPRTETIRIGSQDRRARAEADDDSETQQASNDLQPVEEPVVARGKGERIPSYRLYGTPASSEPLPSVPTGAPALAVVPLPEERARAVAAGETVAPLDAKDAYKNALRMLREQRYDDALAAFDKFIQAHPGSALVGNALYWRGEAHYAKREYSLAREAFETLIARFAENEKIPDSLLKVGLCLRRMGDEAQAKAYFRRVQEKFPKTQAAQIASREGST
jgi:tol-pal system protein YbgF